MKAKITKTGKVKVVIEGHDLHELDITLALIILPALKAFREIKKDIPHNVHCEIIPNPDDYGEEELQRLEKKALKVFRERLDKMIWAFTQLSDDLSGNYGTEKQRTAHRDQVQEGLDLFAKHYHDLWY